MHRSVVKSNLFRASRNLGHECRRNKEIRDGEKATEKVWEGSNLKNKNKADLSPRVEPSLVDQKSIFDWNVYQMRGFRLFIKSTLLRDSRFQ